MIPYARFIRHFKSSFMTSSSGSGKTQMLNWRRSLLQNTVKLVLLVFLFSFSGAPSQVANFAAVPSAS
jgi:hypothetical protein